MTHLESLVAEYYEWMGYFVRSNIKVGKLRHGGWEMELDIVAYHPKDLRLIHIEPSIDADSWSVRESRYKKKFGAGKKYILSEVFPHLGKSLPLEQRAILISHPKGRDTIAGGKIDSIDEFLAEIKKAVKKEGIVSAGAISEQYLY